MQSSVYSDIFQTIWNGFYHFLVHSGLILSHSSVITFLGSSLWEMEWFHISVPNLVQILSIAFKSGDWGGVVINFGQTYKHHPLIKCEEFGGHRHGKMQNFLKSKVFQHWLSDVLEECYVYWTVHHLESWIKPDQFDVICFIISLFTAQNISNVSTSIFRSLRFSVDLFHVLYWSGSMCVGFMVWFGWGGVVSLCRLKH